MYTIDDDFDEAGYMNPLPTADEDDEADGDPQEVCKSGESCWVRFRGAGLELILVGGEDSGATDDMLFWVYTDASESIDIVRSLINVERFDISLNGRSPSSFISFSTSESSLGLSSSIVPSPSRTCGNGCGECGLDLAESVLERRESPLERVESTRGLLPLESVLGRDSGTGGVGVTPDAALTEKREDIDILLAIENREYR